MLKTLVVLRKFESENGQAFMLLFLGIMIGLFMLALVLDLNKPERAGTNIQTSADAASLAGSTELNGALEGWFRAKRITYNYLQNNPIFGMSGNLDPNSAEYSGEVEYFENDLDPTSPYRWTTFTFNNNLVVTIERGYYDRPNLGDIFFSLEAAPNVDINGKCIINTPACACSPLAYQVANAVRLTVNMIKLPTTFAKVPFIEIGQINNISRLSTASAVKPLPCPPP